MRTMRPEAMAEFYSRVFELTPTNKKEGDKNYYLSDGHVTLVIMPWDITDYDGTGIITCGMDHIGFKVENVEACKAEIAQDRRRQSAACARAGWSGAEGEVLGNLFQRSCPLGHHQLADCDGILIDIHD